MASRRGDQAGGQEDNLNAMSMVMFMRLQEEFQTLKRNNEEELTMLRAENVYMKQKLNEETILNTTSLEIVEPIRRIHQSTYNEASFEATQKRRQETSRTFFGTSVGRHSFFKTIIETPLLENWKNSTMDKHDGSTNIDEHIVIYTTQISFYTWNGVILCQIFPTTLKGVALSWFTLLPPLFIDYFDTLVEKFEAQFSTSRPHQRDFQNEVDKNCQHCDDDA